MEKVWEWNSSNTGEWPRLTESFYGAISKTAVCMVGVVNRQYKELRVQLISEDKTCSAYLQRGPSSLRIGIKGSDLTLPDMQVLTNLAYGIDQSIGKLATL